MVSAQVEMLSYGVLPRSERKSKRVFDNREELKLRIAECGLRHDLVSVWLSGILFNERNITVVGRELWRNEMKRYEYYQPRSLDEAFGLMKKYEGRARYVAGGTDAMIRVKQKVWEPEALISLRWIEDLRGIKKPVVP
jgi:hypothetical protein